MAANLRNRISMQPMKSGRVSCSEGASLLFLWVRSRVVFIFQIVFALWCGEWIVQRSLGQSELTATNAPVGRSVHRMGCVFSFGAGWGSSQSISFCC